MFKVGDYIIGTTYDENGDEITVVGYYRFTTDDPEEIIQDVVIETADEKIVYIDEQCARLHLYDIPYTAEQIDDMIHNGISTEQFKVLFDRYGDEMPYGTAKARTGDPYEWLSNKLFQVKGA